MTNAYTNKNETELPVSVVYMNILGASCH